jgi:hypothetical protein
MSLRRKHDPWPNSYKTAPINNLISLNALVRFLLPAALFLGGCTSIPLSTMIQLYKMDPMEADPAQIKVAVRADNRIGIREGGVKLVVGFDAEDGSLNIDENFIVDIIRNPDFSAVLLADKQPGEAITVLGLSEQEAHRMRAVQSSVADYRSDDKEGSGSLQVILDGVCLNGEAPQGEVPVDIFLQTSAEDGFFVFARNLDLREQAEQDGTDLADWPDCSNVPPDA